MKYASEIILKYFPDITEQQQEKFAMLGKMYTHWNEQINVVSRKDIDELYVRHVLHSLSIAKIVSFKPGTNILDVGTGGGFPGIPLAILFPETNFVLVDSIGKKIKVVQEVSKALELENVKAYHKRAEEVGGKFDFVVTRAVAQLKKFLPWVKGKLSPNNNHELKNGVLLLKGGDLTQEIEESGKKVELFPIPNFFTEDFFETKVVAYTRVKK